MDFNTIIIDPRLSIQAIFGPRRIWVKHCIYSFQYFNLIFFFSPNISSYLVRPEVRHNLEELWWTNKAWVLQNW